MARKKKTGNPIPGAKDNKHDDPPPIPAKDKDDDQFSEEVAGKAEYQDPEDDIDRILQNIEAIRQEEDWPPSAQPYYSPIREEGNEADIAAIKPIWNKPRATATTSTSSAAPKPQPKPKPKPEPEPEPRPEWTGGASRVRLDHFMNSPPPAPNPRRAGNKKKKQEDIPSGIGRLLVDKRGYGALKFTIGDVMLLG